MGLTAFNRARRLAAEQAESAEPEAKKAAAKKAPVRKKATAKRATVKKDAGGAGNQSDGFL